MGEKRKLPDKVGEVLTTEQMEMGYRLVSFPEDAPSGDPQWLLINHSKIGLVASIDRRKANSEWIRSEINRHQTEEDIIGIKTRKVISVIRGILLLISFYIPALLYNIAVQFPLRTIATPYWTGKFFNVFWIGILFFWVTIPGSIYLTREEYRFKKHVKTIISTVKYIFICYLFCFILNSMILNRLVLPSLW